MIDAYRAKIVGLMGYAAVEAAKAHAREVFPQESCGFIADGKYVACRNCHPKPETHFEINDERFDEAIRAGTVKAIVHSHPNGPIYPSHLDMVQQIETDVPWIIIPLNEDDFGQLIAWGDGLPIAPVISRPFLHGVFDCYAMIRDVYRLGRENLLPETVYWPFDPIKLPEVPRGDGWWKTDDDLYMANFAKFGFREITRPEARAGDVFLMKLGDRQANPQQRVNHGGVLLEHDQILHHLPTTISARNPAGLWARAADIWLRYEGPKQ